MHAALIDAYQSWSICATCGRPRNLRNPCRCEDGAKADASGQEWDVPGAFDTGDLPPFCPKCGGCGTLRLNAGGRMQCPACEGTGWDKTDPAYQPDASLDPDVAPFAEGPSWAGDPTDAEIEQYLADTAGMEGVCEHCGGENGSHDEECLG